MILFDTTEMRKPTTRKLHAAIAELERRQALVSPTAARELAANGHEPRSVNEVRTAEHMLQAERGRLTPRKKNRLEQDAWWAQMWRDPNSPYGLVELSLFGWRTRYWNFLLKLSKSRPAWTIPAQPGTAVEPFHWTSPKLTVSELGRLQTFPEDMRLNASLRTAQRLAGNAVPSLIGEVLAREIRRQLFDNAPEPSQPKLLPRTRRGCPDPEPVLEVPAKYLGLIGRHPDHPGTRPSRP